MQIQSTVRRAAVLVATLLSACAAPPQLAAHEDRSKFLLLSTGAIPSGIVRVVDARPPEQRARNVMGGYVQFGDEMFSPSPAVALQIALEEHASSSNASAEVKRALLSHEIQLQHFQVLAVNEKFQRQAGQTPAVDALDALVVSMLNSSGGGTKVRVVVAFDVGNFRFSADESQTSVGAPTFESPARAFASAMSPIFRRLDLAFQKRR